VVAGDRAAEAGPAGTFQLTVPEAGAYKIEVDCAGYYRLTQSIAVPAGGSEVTLVLNTQREVFQSITVGEQPTTVDPAQTEHEQRLTGTEVNNIPYPASHSLRNAMKLIPGVIEDPAAGVHFHGGAEDQTHYVLNGFNITDPIDNRFSTRLAVEGVRSMDLLTGRESAQYGGGSAGTLQIETENGTDRLQYTATNFIPGLDTKAGLHFGDWTPRAGISGPVVKGKAWFSDSFDGEYNSGILSGLPSGRNSNAAWSAGNLLHTQVNVGAADIVYADLLTNFDHQAHYGLGVLDPVPTTTALGDREWMAGLKENHTWTGGAMLEAGFGWLETRHDRTPLGDSLYVLSPEGRSGNYFVTSTQSGWRGQLFANFFPKAGRAGGRHQLQAGLSGERLDYSADFRRTAFEQIGLAGQTLSETTFRGSGLFEQLDATMAAYVNDHWQPRGNLYVDVGVRADWDELVRHTAVSPRAAVSWAPFADSRTKISAGYAILHDAVPLALFARALDQQPVTVPYGNGTPGTPLISTFAIGPNLRLPRFDAWSAGAEHDFGRRISGRAEWLRKRGNRGFVYAAPNPAGEVDVQPQLLGYGFGGNYVLTNQRRDQYDEAALTVRQTFGQQYGWTASYVHSRTVSNAVLDINADQPLQVTDNFGAMPWDAPNRFMGWAYLPLPWPYWAAAALVDYRTGFPFPAVDQYGVVQGAVDSHRYPANLDLNLHVERRLVFRGYKLALRVGVNNLTAHRNPTAVNNVIGAPQFLTFYGDEGRHFVVRIRFLGRRG